MGRYICPVCRAQRDVDLSDHIPISTHLKILLSVVFFVVTAWLLRGAVLAVKLAFLYIPLWALAEFFHWSKVRRDSRCPHCHFDPILYQKDWKAARIIIETRLNSIKQKAEQEREIKVAHFLGKEPPQELIDAEKNDSSSEVKTLEGAAPQDLT